jgi:glucosamine--fructose-6-phosphate aminotransferase (isomerizing)
LIAVSRSGETSETLHAVEQFRTDGNGHVLTVSCYGDKPLTQRGDINLVLPSGQEQSIAQTRAFSVLYLATVYLAALWRGDEGLLAEMELLPEVCRALLEQYGESARRWGENLSIERFYFLGSGLRFGLACELSLKMKEMSLSHSEPFHFLEFRHGPQSMVTPDTLMVGLVSSANQASEQAVLDEMRQGGAHILSLGESDVEVAFTSGISEAVRNVLYLPIGQLMAYERAMVRGLDPDHPHNLEAVVRLEGKGEI